MYFMFKKNSKTNMNKREILITAVGGVKACTVDVRFNNFGPLLQICHNAPNKHAI